jgi:adenine-specific DNA methylase
LLDYNKSFIEVQFPVSRISKESYKERKANLGQTLTGLGKWWGRKPLVMVRAALLGTLLPVSNNYNKDREIFLKIMTMDEEGLWLRKYKNISKKKLWQLTTEEEKEQYFREGSTAKKPKYPKGMSRENKKEMKEELQKIAFNRLSYDDKLRYCKRPEEVELTDEKEWEIINEHLKTNATDLQELIQELGKKKFNHIPKVGDCFSGGGSIPFEAARMGAEAFGSDLNPIAALLTWASLNVAGASDEQINELKEFQEKVYKEANKQISEWGIEHNEKGHRADSYLYCNEVECPECGYTVPLAPSWIIGKGTKTVAILREDNINERFFINIIQNANKNQREKSKKSSTIDNNKIYCPHCETKTPITSIRNDKKTKDGTIFGLNTWGKNKFQYGDEDVYKERLYAIKYIDGNGNRYYSSPTQHELKQEEKVIDLLSERFNEWQKNGYIPSGRIEKGYNTDQIMREKGWEYWHQLFNPRQLLTNGLLMKYSDKFSQTKKEKVIQLLGGNKCLDWNSKLSMWDSYKGCEIVKNTFSNQSLNTLFNYGTRSLFLLSNSWFYNINNYDFKNKSKVCPIDARQINKNQDVWFTDPPYADAVNYHELSEFFLSLDQNFLKDIFPEWYTDSKRVLAVKGTGQSFNESMVEIYKNLADNMPDNGYQIVMFTHQDVKVWSELTMILWSAGLKVASAWNISTETNSGGLKEGNYVKGTVLLVLQKQSSDDFAFQDEVYDEIQMEVKKMIDSMKGIDYKDIPDFTDADYLLASYAAALKVLTGYGEIDGIDIDYWLSGDRNEESPVEKLIKKARDVANSYLIPEEFEKNHWFELSNAERFFIRGLELEMNNEHTIGAYQELAKGFGVKEYKTMFHNFEANNVRLKTPSEYKTSYLENEFNEKDFNGSLLRHLLVAILESAKNDSTNSGRTYLKGVFNQSQDYWYKKPLMREILTFISKIEMVDHMEHWHEEAKYAKLLREALKNEGV